MGKEEGHATITKQDYAALGGRKTYEGEVRNGMRNGKGKLCVTNLDGSSAWFDGIWVNDLLNGYGTQMAANGRCFTGWFRDGYLEGTGTSTYEDGKTYNVIFTHGVVTKWL